MKYIWLNDFLLNDVANRVYLDEPIDGLELPNVRTSMGSNAGQSGGWMGAQEDDMRYITIHGHIWSSNVTEALEKRRNIQSVLPLYPESITVQLVQEDGRSYQLEAYYTDFKMPITRNRFKHVFKLDLVAPDPMIYETTGGTLMTAIIQKGIPGGFQFTDTTPQFGSSLYFSAGHSSSTVTNTGTETNFPVITITGKTTNPVLTNKATGESFRLGGYAVDSTAVTVIDMKKHTVTLNGGNAFGYTPLDSQWWGFVPGDNLIEFTSDSGSDVTTASAAWLPGIRGI